MQILKPFPDELGLTHLYRLWAVNDLHGLTFGSLAKAFVTRTKDVRRDGFQLPWTPLYIHQIVSHLSGMPEQEYRARHTLMALDKNWRATHTHTPVKHSKIDVYAFKPFQSDSIASDPPLRLCLQCREEDLYLHRMTYWHRQHHIAGLDICLKHRLPLHRLDWQHAHSASNPASLQGVLPSDSLIQANIDPLLQRYFEVARHILENPAPPLYIHAHEQLLKRATEMGLGQQQVSFSGTYCHFEHELPRYLYTHLPRVWLAEHFAAKFQDKAFMPDFICDDRYHIELKRLALPDMSRPIFLLLALAAVFKSAEEICLLLFDQSHTTNIATSTP